MTAGVVSWAGVALAIAGWGTFTAPMKHRAVRDVDLHFIVFALYQAVGIFLSSLLVLCAVPWCLTWWSLLSAAAWVPANMAAVLCVQHIGIALGQSIWSGLVALVSFLWGQLYFKAGMANAALGTLGIVLLVLGIAALGHISGGGLSKTSLLPPPGADGTAAKPLLPAAVTATIAGSGGGDVAAAAAAITRTKRTRGLLLAVTVGLLAGSTMVPLRLAPEKPFRDGAGAVVFDVGFALGVLVITATIFVAHAAFRRARGGAPPPPLEARRCLLPGVLSGVLWNIANVGSILAVLPPLGLTVGYPLTQACLLVSGTLGIFVHGELSGKREVGAFFAACSVVLAGAALLGVYGTA